MSDNYLLALDMGTSSIGYVALKIDQNDQPIGILDLGVRIFPDGRHPKTKVPLAVERRTARGIRRTRDRGQNRVRRLVKELIEFGLLPVDEKQRKQIFDQYCPYLCRATAANETVDAFTLGRAIFHIGRRRGFKSNRLAEGEAEETDFKAKISQLKDKLEGQTLGEYLHHRNVANQALAKDKRPQEQAVLRFRGGETEFYADRQMYADEFNKIRETQGNTHLSDEQWDALHETAFWQYPLRPVPKGKCRYYPDEARAHIDLPISHDYRIYQEVNNLRYSSAQQEYKLDERQRQAVIQLLQSTKQIAFKSLLKKKDQHKSPYFPSDAEFNLDVASRSGKLHGNRVMCDLRKPELMGDLADELDNQELNDIVHHLIEPVKEVGGKQVVIETEELEAWLQRRMPSLSSEQVRKLCSYPFKRDTASVSRKFMQQIVPVLRDTGMIYSDAVASLTDDNGRALNHSDINTGEVQQKLPYYGKIMPESVWGKEPEADKNKAPSERDEDAFQYGKIANPTVHVALNQLRVVVNRAIEKIGCPPAKIHIELTRDLKNSKQARADIAKNQALNKKTNDRIRETLETEFNISHPRREDIQKYKLWEELGKQGSRLSVFSGKPISAHQLFNGEVEVEHIIPFRRCYDDGMNNKTLAFKNENNQKGNKTPHEAFGENEVQYADMMKRALACFGQSRKYDRFKPDAFEKFYGKEKGDMIARQLNDTKYISRKAKQYLSCLCTINNVVSVNGQMTAVLRDVWQLNHFKDREAGHYRDDHRHHIVDAFVVGLTSRSLVQQLSTRRGQEEQTKDTLYHFLKSRVTDIPELKQELMEKLDHVIASYKPDHTDQGSLFNDTAYGIEIDEEGKQNCITRKAVAVLSYSEIFDVRGDVQRGKLIQFLTDGKGAEDKKELQSQLSKSDFEQKKQNYTAQTGIKKLRINVANNSVAPISSASYKGYAMNSYAYCDVWQIPHKKDQETGQWSYKYEGVFVPYAKVKEVKNNPQRPVDKNGRSHPAAKRLMRLYKDDCLKFTNNKTKEISIMRVMGFSASNNKLDIQPNLAANNEKQKFKSIGVLFGENIINKLRV